ncbi:hypothetical protein, variant [Aphanomyces invadans]|uniref:Major facilitator superfamily (MFS) profile domain-containing protein n=1 Tax=Aphanomyces invadans TaxID=157072 RepID=A0A024UTF0_9STRA|nr:hypothetical protein, variant [Aphanomyces invadans]ETW09634.1 hypothetical protein, variant [Aphanomyces invadans]|eukprot:XP_008861045.1 hypothetical protein, variant [Aphanomyces invadans]
MKDARECIRGAVVLSVAFLLIFTSYNAIENLETSVIRGECQGCLSGSPTGICQFGDVCQDKVQFACDEACAAPFHECSSSLGSTILGVIYLTFTLSAFMGPLIPNYLGMKKSMFGSAFIYALFAFANLIVALNPTNQGLHWAIMIPAAFMEGVGASVLWIAQATYLTELSVLYAKFKHEPVVSSMGVFNGVFYSIFRMSAISGNIISSLVLSYFVWPAESLFVMYTIIGMFGAALMLALPALAKPTGNTEFAKLVPSSDPARSPTDGESSSRGGFSFQALWAVATDNRMIVLAPVFILNGLQQGFATGEFTSNVIRSSLGSGSIGYVMALYGGTNVAASYGFGKLADKYGPLSGQLVGFAAMLVAFSLCYWVPVAKCDGQWALVVVVGVLLSLGDASSTTLTSVVLGQEFPSDAVSVFSIFKVFQSGSAAASYFGFRYLSFNGRVAILISMVLIATASFVVYSKKFRRAPNGAF